MDYKEFLKTKIEIAKESGFIVDNSKINSALKPHQRDAVVWALRGGCRALFESFGLGKSVQQIEFCNIVILNKVDEVNEDEKNEIKKIINTLNPSTRIIEANYAKVDINDLLNTGMFDFNRTTLAAKWIQEIERPLTEEEECEGRGKKIHHHHEEHGHGHEHEHEHEHHSHSCEKHGHHHCDCHHHHEHEHDKNNSSENL